MTNPETATDNSRDLVLVRRFNAPCDLVFRAWTDPEALVQWCGPHGFKAVGDRLEAWPGGRHRACLIAPDGEEHWVGGKYLEVEPPHRLVFTHAWERGTGQTSPETLVTITFRESNGGTEMTFRQSGFESASSLAGHETGWSESFERLSSFVGTESEGRNHA